MTVKTDISLGITEPMALELEAQACSCRGFDFDHTALDHVRVALAGLACGAENN